MSKKQILKNIQKDRKTTTGKEEKDNYFKFISTLAILLIVFILAYFVIGFFYTKEIDFNKKTKETKDEINIDNNTIMIGQLFDQSENEYYALIYDTSDDKSNISTWESSYSSNEDSIKIYKIDSSKKFNSKYIVEKNSNKTANNINELRVVSPTLIKVTNKHISEYIEGEEAIINLLKGN